jgi:uncharacterized membrane protein YbhN (UPF0104 family)
MQNTQESSPKTNFLSEKLFPILKWLLFGLILFVSYQALEKEINKISDLYDVLIDALDWENALKILLFLILIFFNWGFEAKKWQILANKIEKINFKQALQSVLIGLSLGFITPANLGDYAGKIWQLKSENKTKSIGAIMLGNAVQLYVSLVFGVIAYLIIWEKGLNIFNQILFCLLLLVLIFGIVFYQNRKKIIQYLPNFVLLKNFQKYVSIINDFKNDEIMQILLWSVLRYFTFSFQFVLMLLIFKVEINFIYLWAVVCLVFLFKTIIPAINFISDLGVRQYSALYFFSFFSVDSSSVVVATFAVWLLNILFPVLLGSLLVLRMKNK